MRNKIVKLTILLLVCVYLMGVFVINTPQALWNTADVYDFCGYMTEQQKNSLRSNAQNYASTYGIDIVFVLTDNTHGQSSMSYADNFYDGYNCPENNYKYSDNGILFLIDLDNDENYISTIGTVNRRLTDREIDWVLDAADKIDLDDYYGCFSTMLSKSIKYYEDDTDNYSSTTDYKSRAIIGAILGSLLGIPVSCISYAIKGKHALAVHDKANTVTFYKDYIRGNDFQLVNSVDKVVDSRRYVATGYYAPRQSSSSGHSSSSYHGGSSHHSSSGRSHGGGGHSRHR